MKIKILLLEDEPLIGIDLECVLVDSGYEVAWIRTCDEAINYLVSHNDVDLVLMDIELSDGPCAAVARVVKSRRIPFVVHSGHGLNSDDVDAVFHDAPWIAKPAEFHFLLSTLKALVGHSGESKLVG